MIPKDVIEQLVGKFDGCDKHDTLCYSFYKCEKFEQKDVNIDFNNGILEVLNDSGEVEKSFAIKATLEEITKD